MPIREATIDDVDELALLASQTFIDTYDDMSKEESAHYVSEFFSRERIRQHIEDPECWVLVAEDSRLTGYALLKHSEAPISISCSSQIECVRLYVDKTMQGQKLGSKLLEQALFISRKNGYDVLWLKVWDQNEKAVSFYKSKGFSSLGTVPYTDGDLDDQVLIMMRKTGI